MRLARFTAMGLAMAAGVAGALWFHPSDAARGDPAADAANAFLKSLSAEMRADTQFPLDSAERTHWNFVPMARKGAQLLQLDDRQAELIGPLLATALSPEGLVSARGVIKHENILRRIETAAGSAMASRRDPGRYFTSVFGTPSSTAPWAWRFEGHHLSLNVTQLPGLPPAIGPVFFGANPATVPSGVEAGFRLLAGEEDLARELEKIRKDGFAINRGEFYDNGRLAVAAPVLDHNATPVAAVCFYGPTDEESLERLIEPLLQLSEVLSSSLGFNRSYHEMIG